MTETTLPLQQLCDVAIDAAREAGVFVQSIDRTGLQRHFKDAGSSAASQVVTEVDVRSEAIIRQRLQPASEQWDIAFCGEESATQVPGVTPERLLKPLHWSVDPLDGTLPFVEGRRGYAVSIALVDHSGAPLIGVVYDPPGASLVYAIRGDGAYREQAAIKTGALESRSLRVFADASFDAHEHCAAITDILDGCAQTLGLAGVEMVYGSGAVKNACQVLDYPAACYVKLPKPGEGGGSVWDFAATACIVGEAGGWVSDIHGQPLELNRKDSTFMNHRGVLYASNTRIARYLIDRLRATLSAG